MDSSGWKEWAPVAGVAFGAVAAAAALVMTTTDIELIIARSEAPPAVAFPVGVTRKQTDD